MPRTGALPRARAELGRRPGPKPRREDCEDGARDDARWGFRSCALAAAGRTGTAGQERPQRRARRRQHRGQRLLPDDRGARGVGQRHASAVRRMRGTPGSRTRTTSRAVPAATACSIGKNQTKATSLGLHSATLAVTGTGRAGVLETGFDPKALSKEEEKRRKTQRWFERSTASLTLCARRPGRDREADCFELFDVQRRRPRVELLVRASMTGCSERGTARDLDGRADACEIQPEGRSGWLAATALPPCHDDGCRPRRGSRQGGRAARRGPRAVGC